MLGSQGDGPIPRAHDHSTGSRRYFVFRMVGCCDPAAEIILATLEDAFTLLVRRIFDADISIVTYRCYCCRCEDA